MTKQPPQKQQGSNSIDNHYYYRYNINVISRISLKIIQLDKLFFRFMVSHHFSALQMRTREAEIEWSLGSPASGDGRDWSALDWQWPNGACICDLKWFEWFEWLFVYRILKGLQFRVNWQWILLIFDRGFMLGTKDFMLEVYFVVLQNRKKPQCQKKGDRSASNSSGFIFSLACFLIRWVID